MAQTKNYSFCNYSVLSATTVTFTTGTTYSDNYNIFGCIFYTDYTPLQWSIPQALPSDLRVYYTAYSKTIQNGVVTYEGVQTLSVLFSAGQTTVGFPVSHYSHFNCAVDNNYEGWENSWVLIDQPSLPTECVGQPVGCNSEITGTTMQVPSARGTADGEIFVSLSGVTGTSIIYKLNGVTYATLNADSYTYTGLTAGVYQAQVYDGLCYATYDFQLPDGQFSTGTIRATQPVQLAAVNNPVVLTLETAVNSAIPLQSKSRIIVNGTITDNDSIEFNLNYPIVYNAVFTAKNFPDKNIYFLSSTLSDENGVTVGSNTVNEISSSIAECFQQDLVLSRLYYISAESQYINLIAKETTPNLNLTTAQVDISGVNLVLETQQLGVGAYDGQLTANYSLYAEIFVDPTLEYGATPVNANYRRVAELELPFQDDNIHKFQLETVLKNYVSSPAIDFTMTGFTTIPNYDCSYYVRYGEKFPLIANSNTKKKRYKNQTNKKQVCNAALDFEDVNDMASYLGTAASGLNPYFDYEYVSYNGGVYFTELTTRTGTTAIQYAMYQGATKVKGWSNSGTTFTSISDGSYTVKVSGITDGVTFTVQKTFNYNAYNMANGLGFYYSPTTVLPRGYIPWLTNSPSTLYVQRSSKQYLGFLLERGYATVNRTLSCKGDLYFYNGTSVTGVTFFQITSGSTTNFGGLSLLAVGYDELGLSAYENSGNTKIRRVDFAVWQDDSDFGEFPLTETKTYLYEIDEAPTRYGVAFLNKLGNWDIFDFVGEIIYDENIDRQSLQYPREIKTDGSSPLGFIANSVYDTQYTQKITANSGTMDANTYQWLQEMLQSNKIYCYTNAHQNFLIVDSYVANKSTNTNEFSIQVTFKETIFENNVSI